MPPPKAPRVDNKYATASLKNMDIMNMGFAHIAFIVLISFSRLGYHQEWLVREINKKLRSYSKTKIRYLLLNDIADNEERMSYVIIIFHLDSLNLCSPPLHIIKFWPDTYLIFVYKVKHTSKVLQQEVLAYKGTPVVALQHK
jgi:hypothetical protein